MADIVTVVGEHVVLEEAPVRTGGVVYQGRCCFHDEGHPSLIVFPASGAFKCFGCGVGGNARDFERLFADRDSGDGSMTPPGPDAATE